MIKPCRIMSILVAAALLSACGSKPLPQPAAVTNTRDAMSLGMQAYADNRYLEARGYFERALVQYRSVDDRDGQLDALVDLADSALGQGEFTAARAYLADADRILAGGEFAGIAAHVTLLHAYADMQAGDNNQAAAVLDKLINDPDTPAGIQQPALFARTQVAFDLNAADAGNWLGKLGTASGSQGDALASARYQRLQALAAGRQNDAQKAAALYQSALDSYRNSYYRPGIAATLEEWAGLSVTQHAWNAARDQLQRALEVRLWMYDRTHSEKDLEKLSQVASKLGDTGESKQDLQLADYLKNGGNPTRLPAPGRP